MEVADDRQTIVGILFGTAIVAAAIRTATRLKIERRLFLDDAFLTLVCLALTVTTTLIYQGLSNIYLLERVAQEPISELAATISATPDSEAKVLRYQRLNYYYTTMAWLVIFSVKLSFICFFCRLIDRVHSLLLYWRVIIAVNVVAFGFCICSNFIGCPYLGIRGSKLKVACS